MTKLLGNRGRVAAGILVAALAVGPVTAQQNAPNGQEMRVVHIAANSTSASQHVSLPRGKGFVIELDRDAREVFAANPNLVDVVCAPRAGFS